MAVWHTIDDLVGDLLGQFEAAQAAGADDEAAIARAAAILAVHRDDLAALGVSYGLAAIILRAAAEVTDPFGPRH